MTVRWTGRRKAELVARICRDEITADAAMAEHGLTEEEILSWATRYARYGAAGLEQQNIQELRPPIGARA